MKIGFLSPLAVAFIVLKLTHTITWSWLWVLSPIWGSALLVGASYLGYLAAVAWAMRR